MTSPDVVVIGGSNLDLSFRAPRLPGRGEEARDAESAEKLGGRGASQAVAAARFGAEVSLVSAFGQDQTGAEFEQMLVGEGVDLSGSMFYSGQRTGRSCDWRDGDCASRILVAPGANAFLYRSTVARALMMFSAAAVVLCQLETPVEGVAGAIEWAREVGALSVVNAAPVASMERLVARPDLLVANEHEALLLVPDAGGSRRRLAEGIAERFGIGQVIVTCGAAGALLWRDRDLFPVAAPKVRTVDTTGAGDAFCGALAAMLAAGNDVVRAAELACAAGALTTRRPGTMSALPTLAQVRELDALS